MILVNGVETDRIAAQDRGFLYGDGLFETLAVRDGRPLCWNEHVQRLAHGCAALGIPAPAEALLAAEAERLCGARGLCVLRITLTRGPGGRGYAPPPDPAPTRVLAAHDWPAYPASPWRDGIAVMRCETRLAHQPRLAGLKHLNRLEQVLARAELAGSAHEEGLVCDVDGNIVEGTMSNLFLIRGSDILTPDLRRCGVAGIVRSLILDRAADWGLRPSVRDLSNDDLACADELFFTNSIIGVWPARRVGSRELGPGDRARQIARDLASEGCIVLP